MEGERKRQGFCAVLPSHKSLCSFYLIFFPYFFSFFLYVFFAHAPRRAKAERNPHTHKHPNTHTQSQTNTHTKTRVREAKASFVNEISRRHKAAKQCDKKGDSGRIAPPTPKSLGQVTRRADAQRACRPFVLLPRCLAAPTSTPKPQKQKQKQTMPTENQSPFS